MGKLGRKPLFLPYYLVRVILKTSSDILSRGMGRATILTNIKAIHHRPDDITYWGLDKLLYTLADLQAKKGISPPIFDYDNTTKQLQVVDSTFYFFLKNADIAQISSDIRNPLEI